MAADSNMVVSVAIADEVRGELFLRYQIAHSEYRAEVQLGWERQKFFLTLAVAISTGVMLDLGGGDYGLAATALQLSTTIAFAGSLISTRSHKRYKAAIQQVQKIEDALLITDVQTTGGQRTNRGAVRGEWFSVGTVISFVFAMIVLFNVAATITLARSPSGIQ